MCLQQNLNIIRNDLPFVKMSHGSFTWCTWCDIQVLVRARTWETHYNFSVVPQCSCLVLGEHPGLMGPGFLLVHQNSLTSQGAAPWRGGGKISGKGHQLLLQTSLCHCRLHDICSMQHQENSTWKVHQRKTKKLHHSKSICTVLKCYREPDDGWEVGEQNKCWSKVQISPCTAVPPAATQTRPQIICRLLRLRRTDLCAAPMFPQPDRMWSPQGSQKSAPPPSSLRRRGPGLLSKVSSAAVFKQTEGAIAPGHSLGSCLVKKAEVNTAALFPSSIYLPLLSTDETGLMAEDVFVISNHSWWLQHAAGLCLSSNSLGHNPKGGFFPSTREVTWPRALWGDQCDRGCQ